LGTNKDLRIDPQDGEGEKKFFKQTPHPYYPVLEDEVIKILVGKHGEDHVVELIKKREKSIAHSLIDPLNAGFELDPWKDARELFSECDELLILGGNRAGKTEFAAKLVVETLVSKPKSVVWCLHSSLPSSVEIQQPFIRKYLPPSWRDVGKKGTTTNISWTDKNGFSDQVFVTPDGSRCRFLNYTQNISVLEGGECDLIWADELIPLEFLQTLRFRVTTRFGKILITFTPVRGYSPVVKEFISGARTVKSLPAPLLEQDAIHVQGCPPGEMPYIMQPFRKNARVISFHGSMNPFGGFEQVVKMLENKPTTDIKIRAYGWADKMDGGVFNRFDDKVHVVKPDKIPREGTRFMTCDPAGNKNWFLKWHLIDDIGRVFLYREWPDFKTYGEWALPGNKPDGMPGPAQTSGMGKSILAYKKLILEAEGWVYDDEIGTWLGSKSEKIYERLIDPRFGGANVPSIEEGTNIITLMEEEQRDKEGRAVGPSMIFIPAPGTNIEEGIQLINDYLDFNGEQEVNAMNCPRYYISEACQQTIYAFMEYTGRDGLRGAMKDVVDCDRYLFKRGPMPMNDVLMTATGGDQRGV